MIPKQKQVILEKNIDRDKLNCLLCEFCW